MSNFVNQKVPADHYFEIKPLTPELVLSELQTLKITAAGLDNIGPKILKIAAPVIASSLSKVLNASIKSGRSPARWREEAKIICLHKSGDSSNKSNFRPISLLPILSKILERHVANSLNSYLKSFTLISDVQSGIRRNHSCALIKLTQDFYDCLNRKEVV